MATSPSKVHKRTCKLLRRCSMITCLHGPSSSPTRLELPTRRPAPQPGDTPPVNRLVHAAATYPPPRHQLLRVALVTSHTSRMAQGIPQATPFPPTPPAPHHPSHRRRPAPSTVQQQLPSPPPYAKRHKRVVQLSGGVGSRSLHLHLHLPWALALPLRFALVRAAR